MNTNHLETQREAFWKEFIKRNQHHEPLQLDAPLDKHEIYGLSFIPIEHIQNFLFQAANELDVPVANVDKENLVVQVFNNKFLRLRVDSHFDQPDFPIISSQDKHLTFQTRINIDSDETLLATRIIVSFMKKLQSQYKDCAFFYYKTAIEWGDEIQGITFDEDIFNNPVYEKAYNEG